MKLYHNPHCSKSRKALEFIPQGTKIIEYMNAPLTNQELRELCTHLNATPKVLLRNNEKEYKELLQKHGLPDSETILVWVSRHPKLMQRPIFVKGDKAIIARSPEKVLELSE